MQLIFLTFFLKRKLSSYILTAPKSFLRNSVQVASIFSVFFSSDFYALNQVFWLPELIDFINNIFKNVLNYLFTVSFLNYFSL
jgi:hypothetical protein